MPQNVKINIAGREYALAAESEQQEQNMRVAAEEINSQLRKLDVSFPSASPEEKLAFVALSESVQRIGFQRVFESIKTESDDLNRQLDTYLRNK